MALGQDNKGGVGEPEVEISIALDDVASGDKVSARQTLHAECAFGEIGQEVELDIHPEAIEDQVVGFRDGKLAGDERPSFCREQTGYRVMIIIVSVGLCEEHPGVDDERH